MMAVTASPWSALLSKASFGADELLGDAFCPYHFMRMLREGMQEGKGPALLYLCYGIETI